MNTKTMLKACRSVINSKAKENSSGGFNTPNGKVLYTEVAEALDKLIGWVYPKLDTNRLKKVTRCKECSNYKPYKAGESKYDHRVIKMCCLDMKEKDPEFYCKEGEYHEED